MHIGNEKQAYEECPFITKLLIPTSQLACLFVVYRASYTVIIHNLRYSFLVQSKPSLVKCVKNHCHVKVKVTFNVTLIHM